jgi:multidrug efflux pump
MNLSGPFIRRPIGTALLAIGLFMVGLICYLRLGVSALPNIEIPVIFVHASQSGADAATMATTVTAPLERHLGQLPGIDRMRSSSSEGSSLVFMIFQSGHNIDSAALDVQRRRFTAGAAHPPDQRCCFGRHRRCLDAGGARGRQPAPDERPRPDR